MGGDTRDRGGHVLYLAGCGPDAWMPSPLTILLSLTCKLLSCLLAVPPNCQVCPCSQHSYLPSQQRQGGQQRVHRSPSIHPSRSETQGPAPVLKVPCSPGPGEQWAHLHFLHFVKMVQSSHVLCLISQWQQCSISRLHHLAKVFRPSSPPWSYY